MGTKKLTNMEIRRLNRLAQLRRQRQARNRLAELQAQRMVYAQYILSQLTPAQRRARLEAMRRSRNLTRARPSTPSTPSTRSTRSTQSARFGKGMGLFKKW